MGMFLQRPRHERLLDESMWPSVLSGRGEGVGDKELYGSDIHYDKKSGRKTHWEGRRVVMAW
jgi:hypothetical protein